MRSPLISMLLFLLAGCSIANAAPRDTSVADAGYGAIAANWPQWKQEIFDSPTLTVAWVGIGETREVLSAKKVLNAAEREALLKYFDQPFNTRQYKCGFHLDAAIWLENGRTIDLCFGCGLLSTDKQEWSHLDKRALRTLFTGWLGQRPADPPMAPY